MAGAKSWDSGAVDGITVATDRVITKHVQRFINTQGDVPYPSGFEADDDVQSVATYPITVTAGNFTLTVTMRNGETFTTASIAYDATAGTIETAIDVAATGEITDWTNGDITVALGTNLNAGAMTLTFDGDSVKETNQGTTVINDVDLTSDPSGAVSVVNEGVEPVNEVQQIAVFAEDTTGGNYTLAFNVGAQAFTTASLLWNASASTIETAIDASATGNAVPAWVNGDITVSGGPLSAAPLVLTFDGTSTAGTDATEVSIANVDLVGGVPGAESTTTPGVVAVDEVQQISQFGGAVDGGNYSLTLNLAAQLCTTASILWNASAATIETAIDVIATSNAVPGWTNGDVTVAGGDMNTATLNFTYDGASVNEANTVEIILNDVDIQNGTLGSESTLTPGVAPVDEIQGVAVFAAGVSSGNYTLTLNLNSTAVTTDSILYNDNAGTIESAIDTVATGNVADWVNGDVSVSGGGLDSATVNLTYDGANYAGADQVQATISDVDLSGGVPGASSTLTPGVEAEDEGITVAVFVDTVTGGNYTLQFVMSDLTDMTTANIAFDAVAADIEGAINTVFTGNYGGWTNGDITVTGGPLDANAVAMTFDGASVDELNHADPVIASVDLEGHTTTGAETVTTYGQSDRTTMAVLEVMGLITVGGPPPQGTVAGIAAASTRASNPWFPSQETLQALALQAAIEDGSDDLYVTLMTTFGLARLL